MKGKKLFSSKGSPACTIGKSLLALCACLLTGILYPMQAQTVTGTVRDKAGESLIGVSVVVEGTTNGTITDFDGQYSIAATEGDVLVFSYIGMETEQRTVGVKHFALYGASEAGRDYNTVDMSRIRMYNEYLPPYKAAVEAGVGSVMTSFNEIDGVPATVNKWLLTDLLRRDWGFDGFVVTDYTATMELVQHGMGDKAKVSELALNAGTDMDMVSEYFLETAVDLVKSGRVSEAVVDAACRRILEAKYKLGLFDDPYRYVSEERAATEILLDDKLALSKEAAIKSMVLLKNADEVLPLDADQKVAFIGPFVKGRRDLIGNWSAAGDWRKAVTVWEGIEKHGWHVPLSLRARLQSFGR